MSQILSISTLVERPVILIDGIAYELRAREELGLVEFSRIIHLQKGFGGLEEMDEVSEGDAAKAVLALDNILGILCGDIPASKLSDMQKVSIVNAWASQYNTDDSAEGSPDPQ